MKKLYKMSLMAFFAFFFSFSFCFAREVTLDGLGREIDLINSKIDSAYVIGNYVFTANHQLNVQDVMLAARSINTVPSEGETSGTVAYNKMTIFQIRREKDSNGNPTGKWGTRKNFIGDSDFPTNKIDIDFIDYNEVSDNFYVSFNDGKDLKVSHVEEGQTLPEPEKPNDPEKKFLGWFEEGKDTPYNFQEQVTHDLVLEAHYETYASIFDKAALKTANANSMELIVHAEISKTDGTSLVELSKLFFSKTTKVIYMLASVEETPDDEDANFNVEAYQKIEGNKVDVYIKDEDTGQWAHSSDTEEMLEIGTIGEMFDIPYKKVEIISEEGGVLKLRLPISKMSTDEPNNFKGDVDVIAEIKDGYIINMKIDYLSALTDALKPLYTKYEESVEVSKADQNDDFDIPSDVLDNIIEV